MTSKNVLVIPCATQIGVEQYNSLKFNKYFKLIGASHNNSDGLFSNFIKLHYTLENPKFIDEIKSIVKKHNIDILLPSHDEVLYILKNIPELENIIPGSSKEVINTCRFKSKTYDKLSTHPELLNSIPQYQTIKPGFLKPDKGQGSKDNIHINNNLKFLEIAPRIGGGSNINRLNGINLTLSDLYQHLGYDINIVPQNLITEVNRKTPKYNLNFDTLLVDYDDTFGYIKDILYKLNKEIKDLQSEISGDATVNDRLTTYNPNSVQYTPEFKQKLKEVLA